MRCLIHKLVLVLCLSICFGFLTIADTEKPQKRPTYWQTAILWSDKTPVDGRCFTRTVLADHLDEPMELVVADDQRVFFIDRYGAFRVYSPDHNHVRKLNQLPVMTDRGLGLLGLALAPDFTRSKHIYLYYTPRSQPLRQRLSRFTLGDSLLYQTEKVLLEIPWEVENNAHTGGSMAFDEDGNLFLSVGDNTAAFVEDGYASIDERVGRTIYDAQRTAANSRDLRGKILRIHPTADGTYTIPAGNLVAAADGRPEIYIMGCRNPYRITYDAAAKRLFWGDIGPDDGKDDHHGPRGYDEINMATRAGNYGWPYVVADNQPYRAYDFTEDRFGALFNPDQLRNYSVNNTGLHQLPPAEPALIWYPYAVSDPFPLLGEGGRAAMVGAVYHASSSGKKGAVPVYYDGALFAFDWMRNQLTAIWLTPQGSYRRMEPFMAGTVFNKPVDLAFSPDGALYVLEYGSGFWHKNADARLVRIDYNLNAGSTASGKPLLALTGIKGQRLINQSDCRSCHTDNQRMAAPSFYEIAHRYQHQRGLKDKLVEKVIRGGGGVWGTHTMSAHPQLDPAEATEMVDYILSLGDEGE
ncbi:PQQ-dependent sugar dehydrogenase [Arsenicibacter rosenii]|uniref:PQQ-dependent sugar dehydrogenase n=1 Tax=Arsenicibacter rosenii TaxID=1750698 RepID=UPI0009F54750|nr:PQQ-dependent sugar dehydrogenase [Arsenicibacter rosenii]